MPAVPVHHTATVDEPWDGPAAVAAMSNDATTLRYCNTWYDSNWNQDEKNTWKFPHHKTKGGPANLAGVRNALARLSNSSIPDGDKAGVKAHLQAHLGDAKKSEGAPVNTKSLTGLHIKDADQGTITAVFSTLNQIDSDGDVTLPGAFEEGAPVQISAYGHQSWMGALPVGKGTIHTVGDQAILDGQFFMDVPEARSTFLVVKAMGDQQEFSYGYDPLEFSFGEQDGQKVRFLKQLKVFEVSPVLRGAGVGTRLLTAKSVPVIPDPSATTATYMVPTWTTGTGTNTFGSGWTAVQSWNGAVKAEQQAGEALQRDREGAQKKLAELDKASVAIAPHRTAIADDTWDATKSLGGIPDSAKPSDLRSVYAHHESDADPELKASYRLGHHDGVDGAANTRALVMAIAELNAPEGQALPADERKAAYDHLAAHLRDADMEPPELRDGPLDSLKFFDHGAAVMAAVTGFAARASEVRALRGAKGKTLSSASAQLIGWIDEELTRLKGLLTEPQSVEESGLRDDEYSTLMAAVANAQGFRRASQ